MKEKAANSWNYIWHCKCHNSEKGMVHWNKDLPWYGGPRLSSTKLSCMTVDDWQLQLNWSVNRGIISLCKEDAHWFFNWYDICKNHDKLDHDKILKSALGIWINNTPLHVTRLQQQVIMGVLVDVLDGRHTYCIIVNVCMRMVIKHCLAAFFQQLVMVFVILHLSHTRFVHTVPGVCHLYPSKANLQFQIQTISIQRSLHRWMQQ